MSTKPNSESGMITNDSIAGTKASLTAVELQRYFEREAAEVRVRQVQAEILANKLTSPKHKQDLKSYIKELVRLHSWIDEFSKRFAKPAADEAS
jgi:hypothetical protein